MPNMTDIKEENKSLEANAVVYAEAYLQEFTKTLDKFYPEQVKEMQTLGYYIPSFSLYKKGIKDVSLKVFISTYDFNIFFLKRTNKDIEIFNHIEDPKYNKEWTFSTPEDIRHEEISKLLGIDPLRVWGKVSVPGISRYLLDPTRFISDSKEHGNIHGVKCGKTLIRWLPRFKEQDTHTRTLLGFTTRYKQLIAIFEKKNKTTKEALGIGHQFEALWRDVLNYWDWQARKIEIDGEKDDFTAMYRGNHIVGECRWVNKEQDADEVRAFAEKLNPRARSIGLMVAYSGFNERAISQARRSVQSGKTIVLFNKKQIDRIIISLVDPNEIMDRELRDVLDFLYEKKTKNNL